MKETPSYSVLIQERWVADLCSVGPMVRNWLGDQSEVGTAVTL